MAEQEVMKERPKRSTYSDFIGEAEQLPKIKEGYELKLLSAGDFTSDSIRGEIVNQAKIMTSEGDYMRTAEENESLALITSQMERYNKAVITLNRFLQEGTIDGLEAKITSQVDNFKNYAYLFLSRWQSAREVHNQALQVTTDRGEIEALYKTSNTPLWYRNSYGVLVSPQMEAFCRWLKIRSNTEWHNVVIVDGKFGVGKSSFIYSAFTTLEEMFGRKTTDLRSYNGLFFKEKRDYCKGVLKKLPSSAQVWYDEAGNQFGKSSHWEKDQIDLINEHALQRDSYFTNWLAWGDKSLIDSDIRNYTATALITIKERGLAILRQFNENPQANRSDMTNPKMKNRIVQTEGDAHLILENDILTRMVIPYYDPKLNANDKNWWSYKDRKEGAKKMETSIFAPRSGMRADDFYKGFFLSLDGEFLAVGNKIDTELLSVYAKSVGQYMSMNQVASRLARACGTTSNKIFVRNDISNANNGYVTIDEIILSYINRLRAELEGVKQKAKEDKINDK